MIGSGATIETLTHNRVPGFLVVRGVIPSISRRGNDRIYYYQSAPGVNSTYCETPGFRRCFGARSPLGPGGSLNRIEKPAALVIIGAGSSARALARSGTPWILLISRELLLDRAITFVRRLSPARSSSEFPNLLVCFSRRMVRPKALAAHCRAIDLS